MVYNYKWKYVGTSVILEVYLPRVLYAKSNLANMLALFLALQIQPGEVPNRRRSDCVVGHTPFESSRKPVQCTRHGPAFDMKGVQVARLRPERGSFARRMVVADARMSLDPLPPQKSRRRIHWHFL